MTSIALRPNATMMALNEFPAQIQAQSEARIGPVLLPSLRGHEAFPEVLLLFNGDGGPRVMDRDANHRLLSRQAHGYGLILGRAAQGLLQVGGDDPPDTPGIGEDRHPGCRWQVFQHDGVPRRRALRAFHRLPQQRA